MCIIAIKSKGIDMPSEEIMQNMWLRNNDGAGFMYAKDGVVNIEKGFMTYDSFTDRLKKLDEMYNLKKLSLIMHFRITTHGGTKPENCHPFPVTDSLGVLKKLCSTTSIGVAHNGIIDIKPRYGISDTMEYIASRLAPLSRALPEFYKNKDIMEMVSNAISNSKMAFMNGKGEIYTIGKFVEDNGIRYSNTSFETPRSLRYFPYSTWSEEAEWEEYFATKEGERAQTEKMVMWLNEGAGEFVISESGAYMGDEDYAIDRDNRVYAYDYEEDMMVLKKGYRAYNGMGAALRFDWKSPYTMVEVVKK